MALLEGKNDSQPEGKSKCQARKQNDQRRTEPALYSEPRRRPADTRSRSVSSPSPAPDARAHRPSCAPRRLARRPPEHTAPEDVQVEVVDTLATVLAIVHHHPKTAVTTAGRLGNSRGG